MKTLVNIVTSEDPLAAYLFIRERFQPGDSLLFVSERREAFMIPRIVQMLGIHDEMADRVIFEHDGDAIVYERICRQVITHLDLLHHYEVNLAGGSRYVALAVRQVFSQFNSTFYYTQTRENTIVSTIYDGSIYDDDDIFYPINYRATLAEYFELHGLRHDLASPGHTPIRDARYDTRLFNYFSKGGLNDSDHQVLYLLREHYRGEHRPLHISRLVSTGCYRRPPVHGLLHFFENIDFKPAQKDILSHEEVEYLTGGWFEEYVYHLMKRLVNPQDIACGVHISRPGTRHDNELDVVFVKANTLYVIECKTGVDTNRMFNEIVYKACALKDALLGIGCYSYIFSLKKDPDRSLAKIASMMDITFCSNEVLSAAKQMHKVAARMRFLSHEN